MELKCAGQVGTEALKELARRVFDDLVAEWYVE